jgi:hypothetical protein
MDLFDRPSSRLIWNIILTGPLSIISIQRWTVLLDGR